MNGKKTLLITGANGMLGSLLVKYLLRDTRYNIIAVAKSEKKYVELLEKIAETRSDRISFLSIEQLLNTDLKKIYGAIHLAFSRRNRPATDIATSIDFSSKVFQKLAQTNVERVINISSQGIYGDTDEMRTEQTPPAPANAYTMAKFAAEKIMDVCFSETSIEYTNLRLDLVVQNQNLIPALCRQAKEGKIQLRGGEQRFSFIDADDAIRAMVAMLESKNGWKHVYNVGWNQKRYKLTEVANVVADIAVKHGYIRPEIILDRQDISLWSGMNSEEFMTHTGWEPKVNFPEMVENIFKSIT